MFRMIGRRWWAALLLLLLVTARSEAQSTWTGIGADTNWSTAGNWDMPPISAATLQVIFGNTTFLTSTVDANYDINQLTFTNAAGAYTLDGAGVITFRGTSPALTHNGNSTVTIDAPVAFAGNGTIGGTGTGNLILNNLWSQNGVLTVSRNITVNTLRLGIDGGTNHAAVQTGANTLTLTGDIRFEVLPSQNPAGASAPAPELGGNVFLSAGNHSFIAKNYSSVSITGEADFNISAILSGPGGFTKTGDAVSLVAWLVFSNQNTYTGPTILGVDSELTYAGVTNALPPMSAVTIRNGAVLYLSENRAGINGFNQTIGSLSDAGSTNPTLPGGSLFLGPDNTAVTPVLTLGGDNTSTTYGGQIRRGGSIVKVGTGTFTVTAPDSDFLGGVTVNGGRFNTNLQTGTQSGTGAGNVTVNTGATFGGTGRSSGAVTVNNGGRLAPGTADAVPGTLTVFGSITLNSGATFLVRLNGTGVGQATQLVAQNAVTLTGSTLTASLGYTPAMADRFFVINMTSNGFVTGEFAGLPQASSFTIDGNTAYISYFGDIATNTLQGGNDVVISFTPIPEPTTILGLAVAVLLVGRRVRRLRSSRNADLGMRI